MEYRRQAVTFAAATVLSLALSISSTGAEGLDDAWAVALAANQRLEATRWSASSAHQQLQASIAERLPAVTTLGSYQVRDHEPAFEFDFAGVPGASGRFPYQQDAGFSSVTTVRMPLYTSGRVQHGIAAAESKQSAANSDVETSIQGLKLSVAEAYSAVLSGQHACRVAETTVRSLASHNEDVAQHYRNQLASRNDALMAEVALTNAHQDLVRLRNELDLARSGYNRLLGRALDSPVELQELTAPAIHPDLPALTERAMRRRPELVNLAAQSRALQHQASSLRAETKPQVEARGGYAFEDNRYQAFPGIASAGVTVEWNAFDGGRKKHRAMAASHEAEAARRLRKDMESLIALEVRRAWLETQETQQRLVVKQQAVNQAEENLRVTKQQFSQRRATNADVLNAEALRSRSHLDQYNSIYDAALSVLRLKRAVGDL